MSACINRDKLSSKENLEKAFAIFDKVIYCLTQDSNGFITLKEIKNVFSGKKNIKDAEWERLIKEVDENNDEQVSLKIYLDFLFRVQRNDR